MVTDMQFSGQFGFEGLQFVQRLHAKVPSCRIVVMTGQPSDALRREAIAHGATALLGKPFETRDLERVLALLVPQPDDVDGETVRVPTIDDVIAGDELMTVFQPVVAIGESDTPIVGYEALARLRGGWPVGTAAELFQYGERRHRLIDLNFVCLRRAIASAARLPGDGMLFINLDPTAFARPALAPLVDNEAARAGIDLSRIVLEVTERAAFPRDTIVDRTLDALRSSGVRLALDDVGSAYSHLEVIDRIRPSFVKIAQSFGTGFERDATKLRIVRHVQHLARDFDCAVVIEGIESAETAAAAAKSGIAYAQGYRFGRPADAGVWSKSLRMH